MSIKQSAATTCNNTRPAGIAIAAATILSTVFVALDQSPEGNTAQEILQSMVDMQVMKTLVHSVAIASVCAYAYGFAQLATRLGLHRPVVLAGLSAFIMGCFAMIVATTFDGLISTDLARNFVNASPEAAKQGFNLIVAYGSTVTEFAKVAWVLQAVAGILWSVALMREQGLSRIIAACGVISSAVVIAAVVLPAQMTLNMLLGILISQALWNLAAAVWLIRSKGSSDKVALPIELQMA